ncbi:MAG: hypothetical protein CMB87_03295 [Flammeovirgaceae bacterium]|nr:hypothetical protein [Flammeovirgaceae bacterium]
MIVNMNFILFLFFVFGKSFQNQNHTLENNFIRVNISFKLKEETKKKNIYDVDFLVQNRSGVPLYYVSRYTKLENKESQNNFNINPNNDNIDDIDPIESGGPPPLSSSAYVDSGGAKKVDDTGSSQRGGGRKISDQKNDKEETDKNDIIEFNYIFSNELFELYLNESRTSKFTLNPLEKPFYFKNKEEFRVKVKFDNSTENIIDIQKGSYNPVICVIPTEGLSLKSTLETNKKNGLDVNKLTLIFSKEIYYSNKIKLQLDKNFHSSIDEAKAKFLEMQSVLQNNLN